MLEARLLVKLVEAKTLWDAPEHYTNDAQDVINEAISMATDTEWEDRLAEILKTEGYSYDQIMEQIIAKYPGVTEKNIYDVEHTDAADDLRARCHESDESYNEHVVDYLDGIIDEICTKIGDKVHRRNLQIAELKRENSHELSVKSGEYIKLHRETAKAENAIGNANLVILSILGEIDSAQGLDRSTDTIKDRLYKITNALKI